MDEYHLDSPPTKRAKTRNVAKTLREPSAIRQKAQRIITRGELQRSASPEVTRKLIGTYIKDTVKEEKEDKEYLKQNIKEEDERIMNQVNTRRKNKSWPKDARLVHVDRTPCSEECMKTHNDEDGIEPVLNKSIEKTYGKTSIESEIPMTLQGVPDPEDNAEQTTLISEKLNDTQSEINTKDSSTSNVNLVADKSVEN